MSAVAKSDEEIFAPLSPLDLSEVMRIENDVYPFPWTRANFEDALRAGHTAWALFDGAPSLIAYSIAMLAVDEAHLLTPELLEEIRLLSNADTYQEKLLQIVLCGQPELLGILRKPELRALRQRVASSCSLRPLSLPEVRAYIAERLHSAGLRGATSPFPTQVLEEIVRLTEGVPRLVNLLCDACLAIGCKAHRPVIDLVIVKEAASELGLDETHIEPAIEEKSAVSGNGTAGKAAAGDAVIGSALDLLVQAMKRRRALVPEVNEVRSEMSIKEQVAVAVNAVHEKDPAGDKVIESAVDVLVQAMKLRRNSTLEL